MIVDQFCESNNFITESQVKLKLIFIVKIVKY